MASRIKGITVEIGGDTSGLEKSLAAVNNSIKKTQSQLRDVNNLLKLDPSNTILLAQKQELLQSAIGDTEKKLEALEQAQEDVAKAFERGDLGKDRYMAFQREVEETRGALNRYKADLSGLQSEQERLASNTERLNPQRPEQRMTSGRLPRPPRVQRLWKPLTSYLWWGIRSRMWEIRRYPLMRRLRRPFLK